MKLRTKYILFVVLVHLVTLSLSYYIFRQNKVLFIASELVILLSIYLSWQLYHELIQPLKTLMRGVQAIKDKDFNIKFLMTGKFEMDQLIEVYNNMIEELRKERTRQEQQHFFLEKLIQTSPTGILILDHDGKIHQVNPRALSFLNMEEKQLLGKSLSEIRLPLFDEIQNLITGEAKTVTLQGVNTYKLQKSHFIDRGFPRFFIMMEELTAEILAAEKKAYGKVIRMMAHEVNNTVGPVNSILESAIKSANKTQLPSSSSMLNALQVAVDRNQNLNLFMRNFAEVVRLPEAKKKKVDLHSLVKRVAELWEPRAREKDITFFFQLDEKPVFIEADELQMEQALINIVKNAMEAIGSGGQVTFNSSQSTKTLKITDTGSGIPKEIAAQLFSPFFSTKKDGQGIGLTLVKEILINHHFEFNLETVEPGKTEFVITF